RWFIDNFSRIAEWHATFLRVMVFRDALLATETLETGEQVTILPATDDKLRFQHLTLTLPDGESALDETDGEIAAGEHVEIVGGLRSGKTTLFRVLAGLWHGGSGTIYLPSRDTMMFLPERPYVPLGSLRSALIYPEGDSTVEDEVLLQTLDRVGLGRIGRQ